MRFCNYTLILDLINLKIIVLGNIIKKNFYRNSSPGWIINQTRLY